MLYEIKVPSPGESISEVEIANWLVQEGDFVTKDQEIAEIESEKATLTLIAEASGIISININNGSTAKVGDIACTIDSTKQKTSTELKKEDLTTEVEAPSNINTQPKNKKEALKVTPVAKKIMDENNISIDDLLTGNKRVGKKTINTYLNSAFKANELQGNREETRIQMSQLRKKISERLVTAKNETAMLTTFNEVDMHAVIKIRNEYKNQFITKHGIKLGFMSFFAKAASIALMEFKNINGKIDGQEIITHNYTDIGIAVQTDKGLMVPILKNVNEMNLPEIEKKIFELAEKARTKKITIDELEGGTFTITNGGIFGSMLSTPIINYPQAAILGMHNIVDRPIAINGKVDIRPIMYLALSYDHRIIDGKDSVGFLIRIKELIENPVNLLFNGNTTEEILLDL